MIKTKPRNLKIISYNLHYHRANSELENLVSQYNADILCVQECYPELLLDTIGGLVLADKTTSGKFGMAIYYRQGRFANKSTSSHMLKNSVLERVYMPPMERLLVTELRDNLSGQDVSIGSFHATHFIASNYLRRAQIKSAHAKLTEVGQGSPTVMVGDYNYPLFKRRLKTFIEKSGYQLSLSDKPTHYISKVLGVRLDLVTSINAQVERVLSLPKGISDHTPILVQVVI
jgi:endonuclease/exonuclease/phosphatase family metal-dependent hydrolase